METDREREGQELERLRGYFAADRFARGAGITLEAASPERVVCAMEVTDAHRNAGGGVQGGAIFTLADFAFAVHSNRELALGAADRGLTVGQSCAISFLRGLKGSRLIAESTCLSRGRNISVYRVAVRDDTGILLAEMTGNGFTTAPRPPAAPVTP